MQKYINNKENEHTPCLWGDMDENAQKTLIPLQTR